MAFRTIFFQPFFFFLVIRHGIADQFPKTVRMVELNKVRQFVDDDVILHIVGRKKQAARKVEVAISRTTAPIRVIVLEIDAFYGFFEKNKVQFVDAARKFRSTIIRNRAAQKGGNGFLSPLFCIGRGQFEFDNAVF